MFIMCLFVVAVHNYGRFGIAGHNLKGLGNIVITTDIALNRLLQVCALILHLHKNKKHNFS